MMQALPAVAIMLLVGCMNTIEAPTTPTRNALVIKQAQVLVADKMRDPEAVRFKPEVNAYTTSVGDTVVCGTMNAKNAMGGYVGYRPYYARIRNGKVEALRTVPEDDEYGISQGAVETSCREAAAGLVMVSS